VYGDNSLHQAAKQQGTAATRNAAEVRSNPVIGRGGAKPFISQGLGSLRKCALTFLTPKCYKKRAY
jgi:hypothetical protein